MKIVWFPQWACQNYDKDKSFSEKCPYCPYGMKNGKLLMYGKETASNDLADSEDVIGFFRSNKKILGSFLEISGGEPLLYPHLAMVLSELRWKWAVTSNTLHLPMIKKLAEKLVLKKCSSWTASYHPLSGNDEVFADSIRYIKKSGMRGSLRATVVVTDETADLIPESIKFLGELPLHGVQFHMDCHRHVDYQKITEMVGDIAPDIEIVEGTGKPPSGIICAKHSHLVALGADGTLYECVTKAYQNIDPICKVNKTVLIDKLPEKNDFCQVPCFAVCDHVKHIKRNAVPLTIGVSQ